MFSFGSNLKFLGKISPARCRIPIGLERRHATRPGDEDIKWQWSVRESPCHHCKPYARPGLLARLVRRRQQEELTNRHYEVKHQPKIWELAYYSYLLPDCEARAKQSASKSKRQLAPKPGPSYYSVCSAKDYGCDGKKKFVPLKTDADDDLKPRTDKLRFDSRTPFCLNEVCGKGKPPKEEVDLDNSKFKCLNDFVEGKEKEEKDKDCKE